MDETEELSIISCQIGDGITAAINTNESCKSAVTLLGVPDSGKFSGETDFLTSDKFAVKENLAWQTKFCLWKSTEPLRTILPQKANCARHAILLWSF